MSTPLSTSGLSVELSISAGSTVTGRRFAQRPSEERSASSPCSGRTLARGSSHFGPPTAPQSTASARSAASIVSGRIAMPWASMQAPPTSSSLVRKSWPKRAPIASRARTPSAVTSGPMPSPASTRMSNRGHAASLVRGRSVARGGLTSIACVCYRSHPRSRGSRPRGDAAHAHMALRPAADVPAEEHLPDRQRIDVERGCAGGMSGSRLAGPS